MVKSKGNIGKVIYGIGNTEYDRRSAANSNQH